MSSEPLPPRLRQLCHDLSQPVTTARCSLELALSLDPADPARAEFFTDAIAALDRLVDLTAQIRDWSGS